jgi:hypothetical protein
LKALKKKKIKKPRKQKRQRFQENEVKKKMLANPTKKCTFKEVTQIVGIEMWKTQKENVG